MLSGVSACNCGRVSPAGDGGTSTGTSESAATSGLTTTGGSSGGTASVASGASSSTGGDSTSTSAGSSTDASSSSGGSRPSCGTNAVWLDEVCTLLSCTQAPIDAPCLLPDGGEGFCGAGICQGIDLTSSANCGTFGLQCPQGSSCIPGSECAGCGAVPCPAGTTCIGTFGCAWSSCNTALTDQACLAPDGSPGFCCGSACVAGNDPSNCGACGLSCGSNAICKSGTCVPVPSCSSAPDNSPCALPSGAGFCCHGACQDPATDSQDCQACGQSCTPCSRPTTGCTQGQGCTVDKLCAPLSCTGLSDGMACSLPDLVPSPPRAPAAFSSSTVARFSSPSAAAALAPTWTSTPRTAAPAACAAQPGPLARVEFATRRSTALPPRAEAPAGSGQGAGRGSAVVAPHASTSIPT